MPGIQSKCDSVDETGLRLSEMAEKAEMRWIRSLAFKEH